MLKDEDKLWRYTNFTDLLYMIMYKAIPLINATKFEDKLEGYNPYKSASEWKEYAKNFNISCWHKNEYESDAMWKLFSSDLNSAVAIQTTYKDLKNVASESFRIEEVEYLDYKEDFGETKEPILCKRKRFEYEKEVRIIEKTGSTPRDISWLYLGDSNLKLLLQEIHICPYAPYRFNEVVKFALDKLGIVSILHGSNEFQGGIII